MKIDDIDHIQHLKTLLTCFANISNSIKGQKVVGQDGLKYAESIGKKVFSHIASVKRLYENKRLDLTDGTYVEFIDYSSIAVLTRASLESYLTFNYIFIAPQTKELSQFRFHCWDLAGFLERQDIDANSAQAKKVKLNEAQLIIIKNKYLRSLDEFNKLSNKQQNQILKGNWKLNSSWSDLAVEAKFNREYFRQIYSFLCSYAHTGRLSVLQIMQANKIDDQREFGSLFSAHCLVTISKLLFDYAKLIPQLEDKFNSYKSEKFIATIWKNVGERLEIGNS